MDSVIIANLKLSFELFSFSEIAASRKWSLLYRSSRDGFAAFNFHARCDNRPNTLIIVKTNQGFIFGGYTEAKWDQSNTWKADPNAFIFSLVNPKNRSIKLPVVDYEKAINCNPSFGPIFGFGEDICISNSNANCSSFIHSYKPAKLDETYLTGSRNFNVSDMEVFERQ